MNTFDTLANDEQINKVVSGLKERGLEGIVVENKEEALEKIKEMIPSGASVMNGASQTLEQIGFVEYFKSGKHSWNNLHTAILAEKDPVKQAQLRLLSSISDFYLGSVHAISEDGQLLIASNSGSQLPHIVFTSKNIIFVVGTQKITASLDESMKRLEQYVFPLEDKRMKEVGYGGSSINKVLIFKKENTMLGRKVSVILIKEKLGF